jgi:hypothetical protein
MEDFAEKLIRVQLGSQGFTQFHARKQLSGGQGVVVYHKLLQSL